MFTAYNLNQMLELEKFRQWVESMKSYEIVGYTREDGSCPIANYVLDNLRRDYRDSDFGRVSIDYTHATVYESDSFNSLAKLELPEWAKIFVARVDDLVLIYPEYEVFEDDETGQEYESDEPNDHMAVFPPMCIEVIEGIIETFEEMSPSEITEMVDNMTPESHATMLKEYSY